MFQTPRHRKNLITKHNQHENSSTQFFSQNVYFCSKLSTEYFFKVFADSYRSLSETCVLYCVMSGLMLIIDIL